MKNNNFEKWADKHNAMVMFLSCMFGWITVYSAIHLISHKPIDRDSIVGGIGGISVVFVLFGVFKKSRIQR